MLPLKIPLCTETAAFSWHTTAIPDTKERRGAA